MTYYTSGRCPLCHRATLHLTLVGVARMEQRGYCDMCKREQFMIPIYYLELMEQSLLQVASWDADTPGPVPIMARAHQLPPDARGPLRALYQRRMGQRDRYKALLVRAGALQDYSSQERAIRAKLHQLVVARKEQEVMT